MLCGWLSPDGEFYPCGPYEHIHLAEELADAYYPNIRKNETTLIIDDYLLDEKWFKLFSDGLTVGNFMFFKERCHTHPDKLITTQQVQWIVERQHLL